MREVSLKELLEAGCHFGHQTTRWNPKMKPYIFTARDKIHIFDLAQTKEGLGKAGVFIKESIAGGQQIMFVGTKRQAQEIVKEAAIKVGVPYMTRRWVGGFLTNWNEIKKRLDYLKDLKTGKTEGKFKTRTKKENLLIDRQIVKMESDFGGAISLESIPDIVFVVDARKGDSAIREARSCGLKVVAIVDTNSNPDMVDFVIPANDDATRSIQLVVDYLVEAVEEGKKIWELKKKQEGEGGEKKDDRMTGSKGQSKEQDNRIVGNNEQLGKQDSKMTGSSEQSGEQKKGKVSKTGKTKKESKKIEEVERGEK